MNRSEVPFPLQPLEAPKDQDRKKGKGGKTVSSYFKGQLDDLMTTLYKTEPHFIRCVVPNTHKEPGGVESGLVMHQYQCNGVLAGIAICRKGFPNKMLYPEFKGRYNIIAAKAVAKAKNDKAAAGCVMDVVKLDKEKFRLILRFLRAARPVVDCLSNLGKSFTLSPKYKFNLFILLVAIT